MKIYIKSIDCKVEIDETCTIEELNITDTFKDNDNLDVRFCVRKDYWLIFGDNKHRARITEQESKEVLHEIIKL